MVKRTHTFIRGHKSHSLFKLPCLWRKHSAKHIPFPQVQEFTCKVSEIWRKKKQWRYFNNRPFWYSDGSTEYTSHNHKRRRTENPVIIIFSPAKVASSLWKKWTTDKRHVTCRDLTGPASMKYRPQQKLSQSAGKGWKIPKPTDVMNMIMQNLEHLWY